MATVVITGISGFLGQRVDEQVRMAGHEVVGVDRRPPAASPDLRFFDADVRSSHDVARALAGADAVVHLAAAEHNHAPDHSVNVGGTQVVVDAAVAADVQTLVVLSSAMVYGAHPDNPVPLTEQAPLRADPDFPAASQKVQVEHMVAPLVDDPEAPRTVVLRPAMMVGADAPNLLTRSLQGARLVGVRDHHPPVQFVHVDDVASAVSRAIDSDMAGAYNVACSGSLSTEELRELLGHRVVEVPEELAFTMVDRSHALGLTRLPPSGLAWVMHPWVVSNERLEATGWKPTIDNRDAAELLAAEQADTIAVAGVRADRTTVRRVGIAAGMVGGVLALGVLARRRRGSDAHADDEDDRPGGDPAPDDDGAPDHDQV